MEEIKKMLVNGYKAIAFTDKYIYGFIDKKLCMLVFQMTAHWIFFPHLIKGQEVLVIV
jgi:hypothetical protein